MNDDPLSAFKVRHPARHAVQAHKAEKRVYTVDGGQKLTIDQIWEFAKKVTPGLLRSTICTRLERGQRQMKYLCEAPRKTCITKIHPIVYGRKKNG
jgi:hypothetical protein